MQKQGLQEKAERLQEERIREMEQVISLLEEENSLQRQLIEKLQEQNSILEKYVADYSDAMHRMLGDTDA